MKRDINFAHLGNGISVYDRLHEKNGDYESVAHIDRYRVIEYRANVTEEDRKKVEIYAATKDPRISTAQDQKVFATRPGIAARIKKLHAGSNRYGICEVCHKNVDITYLLTPFRAYQKQSNITGLTHYKTNDVFGHRDCCVQALTTQPEL